MEQTAINKISRPAVADIFPRARLFGQLDQSLERPVAWISGPGGAGKSTLAASYLDARRIPCLWYQVDAGDGDVATLFYYLGLTVERLALGSRARLPLLTPEYQTGLAAFASRYFEQFFSLLPRPFIVVFDDYHEVPQASPFHEVMLNGLLQVPEGVRVLVTSRSAPPPALIRLRARRKMGLVGWSDLRLTPEETAGIVRLHDGNLREPATIDALHDKTQGWVAGLVLMMERGGNDAGEVATVYAERTPAEVFDYFAWEAFNRMEKAMQDFLLRTALLPTLSTVMAAHVSGNDDAPRILAELNRNNYFTERRSDQGDLYRYHPLFREFLLKEAEETYAPDVWHDIKCAAFSILSGHGYIDDAAHIARGNRDWDGLGELIINHAESFIKNGRWETVRGWLDSIPEKIREQSPDLLYWHGTALSAVDPAAGLPLFRKAFNLFRQRDGRSGMFLAWSGMVNNCHCVGDFALLDQLAAQMEAILGEDPSFPSIELEAMVTMGMFHAMSSEQPQNPELPSWEHRAFKLVHSNILDVDRRLDACIHLIGYHLWMGNLAKVDLIFDHLHKINNGKIINLKQISIRTIESLYDIFKGSLNSGKKKIDETLKLSHKAGLHGLDVHLLCHRVSAYLSEGDIITASSMLHELSLTLDLSRKIDLSYYYLLLSWTEILRNDSDKARHYLDQCFDHFDSSGFYLIKLHVNLFSAGILHLQKKSSDALCLLSKIKPIVMSTGSKLLEYFSLIIEARILMDLGNEKEFISVLGQAMSIGRQQKIVNFYCWQPDVMARLCLKALEEEIEVEYVQDLIRRRNLVPDDPPLHIENWPWPVKIHALGRFALEVNGASLAFSGKVPKKPLELLKIIVAQGGREVSEAQVTDALWPDADGDTARQSFKVTLHRLRQLLGIEGAVLLCHGRLTLDGRQVWTDVGAFEHLLDEARAARNEGKADEAARFAGKAAARYRGEFLPGEDAPWAVPMRQRLQAKCQRCLQAPSS